MSVNEIIGSSLMLIIKIVVNVYSYLTLPFYYFKYEPWNQLNRAKRIRAKLENPSDPKSGWLSLEPQITNPIVKPTLTEIIEYLPEYHGRQTPSLGYREVLHEEQCIDSNGNPKRIDGRVLKMQKLSEYKWLTFGKVDDITKSLAKSLAANGVSFGDKVLILSETRIEWFLSSLSLTRLGACVVTLFSTLDDEGLVFGINHSGIEIMIISSEMLLKVRSLISRMPTVRTIVYITDCNTKWNSSQPIDDFPDNIKLMSYEEMVRLGNELPEQPFKRPKPDDLLYMIYTSGTTGKPKPVMITHRNLIGGTGLGYLVIAKEVLHEAYEHSYLAYLPLAHVFELTTQTFFFYMGVRIGYSSPQTMADSGVGLMPGQTSDMRLLKPTIMIAVPLVLDKMVKEIYTKLNSRSFFLVSLFNYLIEYKSQWILKGYDCSIMNAVICRLARARIGGRLIYMFVGGAPLNPHIQKVVKNTFNIKLMQGYGATEITGATLTMDMDDLSYGRAGPPLCNTKIKLEDWVEGGYQRSDKPNPRGEMVIGGDRVSPGYYNYQTDDNQESFTTDSEGVRWFRTGDIAECFPDGTFKIIDRRKDLQKLSNGKFVSLGSIEGALKTCPYVDNVCVCGGPYSNRLVAIVSLNHKNLISLSHDLGLEGEDIASLCDNNKVYDKVYAELYRSAKAAGIAIKEMPAKIRLVCDEWTPDNDMLTAALKLKRQSVLKKYKQVIDSLIEGLD